MRIVAAFWDINNDGVDIGDVAIIVGVLVVLWRGILWSQRRVAKKLLDKRVAEMAVRDAQYKKDLEGIESRIRETITRSTKLIQPEYRNDGHSITDIADKLKDTREDISSLHKTLDTAMRVLVEHVASPHPEKDGA